ncbi:phage tail terminator-like protein [Methanoculleus sp.]|uniref:phage tail terminator-like protein n=1 Tax=Methanoculleus sp. TaxID=90427 RepID=UPI0025DD3207|nr:phage tail terminator-like protein [Methanoculleus sp.]MCK9319924.1 DUF4128 domain-containing protein [Methanoculleus sp.]
MDVQAIKTAFEAELNSWWPTAGNTPINWENVPFTPPAGIFITPLVTFADATENELGSNPLVLISGIFSVLVSGPVNSGSGAILAKVNLINNRFSSYKFSDVHTGPGRIVIIGEDENKYHVQVRIPFKARQRARS